MCSNLQIYKDTRLVEYTQMLAQQACLSHDLGSVDFIDSAVDFLVGYGVIY